MRKSACLTDVIGDRDVQSMRENMTKCYITIIQEAAK